MLFSQFFKFSNRNLIRNLNSLSPDIVSSLIRAKVSIPTTEYFGSLIQKKEIKIKCWKNDIVDGTNQMFIYPSDLDSFTKICSNKNLFTADQVKKSGTLVIPNRLSIQIKSGIEKKLKNEIKTYPNFIYNLLGEKICHLFCNNSEDFNSLFFMNNGGWLDIKRTVFPYMYKTTLKLTPNILSVVLPPDVDTVIKAADIFSAYGFNRITKPSSTGSWLFYLQNEADYMKMLSTPNYYLDKVIPIMPYYGTPLVYTPGEKEAGKIIHIFHSCPAKIGPSKLEFKNFFNFTSKEFENKKVDSYYFTNTEDFNALRFSNGQDLYNGHKYTMVVGDQISSDNISSPYLGMKLTRESESGAILGKIKDRISYYEISKFEGSIYLDIIPKSFADYKNLLDTKFECENNKLYYFCSKLLTHKGSFLLNSIVITENFYTENKLKLESNKNISVRKINSVNYIVVCEQNKVCETLFYLSNLSPKFRLICRSYTKLYRFDKPEFLSTMKSVILPKSKLASIMTETTTAATSIRDHPYYDNFFFLNFDDVSKAYPFLFIDHVEEDGKYLVAIPRLKTTSDKSLLIVHNSLQVNFSAVPLIHSLNLVQLYTIDNFTYYHVKIESLHDYSNIISFCDSFGGYRSTKFIPGTDLVSL